MEQGVRDLTLRTYGRVGAPEEFGDIPIANVNGTAIRVREVATIQDSMADIESAAMVGGKSAVVLMIRKQSGTNAIEVVDGIKERVAEVVPTLPPGYKIDIIRDQSEFVLAAVGAVKEHLILGSIFAALVVWLFLSSPRFWTVLAMLASTLTFYSLLWGLPSDVLVLREKVTTDAHRRGGDSQLAHRHVRGHGLHGLHAQRHHSSGADAGGGHRHR